MANPLFTNPFQQAYLDVTDTSTASPFAVNKGDASRSWTDLALRDPRKDKGIYNLDVGPTDVMADSLGPKLQSFQSTDEYFKNLFQPAQSTEDMVANNPLTEGLSSSVIGRSQAQNTAQAGKSESNAIQDAYNSVQELMKGGKAIPRTLAEPEPGSGKTSGLDLTRYAGVDRDIRGNIIGLTARMQYDPTSGAPVKKIGTDWSAKTGELGSPYTPGLDAFKQAQAESARASASAASTPAALQSAANRQALLESKKQEGANVVAQTKAERLAAGFDPETGVYDPRGDDTIARESTSLMRNDAARYAAQAPNSKSANIYDKAVAALSPTGNVAFGKYGYAYSSDRASTPASRAFMETEMQKKRKEMGV